MFKRRVATVNSQSPFSSPKGPAPFAFFAFEALEGRRLLSGSPGFHDGFGGGHGGGQGGHGAGQTVLFSQLPTTIQSGLDALAATDSVTAPSSSTTVYLGNSNGVETYTLDVTSTGTDTRLTVDAAGKPVTAPTVTSTTFGALTNTAVTSELTAIASALNLTAPISSTTVRVSTASDGTSTYTIFLADGSSTTTTTTTSTGDISEDDFHGGRAISVDSNGNPVGHEQVPLSTLPTAVQNGLTGNAPSGATALTSSSLVSVNTVDGVTLYTADYSTTGTSSTVTVNASGTLTSLPTTKTIDYSTLPSAAQTELQTLATADGVSGTISSTQTVQEYDAANGNVIYTVSLSASSSTSTSGTSSTGTYTVTISVDQAGNPTVTPRGGFGEFGDFGGFGHFSGGGLGACDGATTTSSTTTGTTTTTTSGTSTTSGTTTSSTATAASAKAAAKAAKAAKLAAAKAAKLAAAKAARLAAANAANLS